MPFLIDTLVVAGMAAVNVGTIQESDGTVERTFRIVNGGDTEVVLDQGYTSCHCTTIDYERGRLLTPGDSAAVTLRFNPQGKGGEFYESGTIVYGERKRLTLSLEGECVTSEETLLRQFPIRLNESTRLNANRFDLGIVHVGDTKERSVAVLHRDEGDRREVLTVSFTPTDDYPRGVQQVVCPLTTMCQGQTVSFDILLDFLLQ